MKVNEEAKEKTNESMGRSHQELFITICFENVWYIHWEFLIDGVRIIEKLQLQLK